MCLHVDIAFALLYPVFSNIIMFFMQDIHFQGKELREAPAPLGYH